MRCLVRGAGPLGGTLVGLSVLIGHEHAAPARPE
jgi:hypothetical protein